MKTCTGSVLLASFSAEGNRLCRDTLQ